MAGRSCGGQILAAAPSSASPCGPERRFQGMSTKSVVHVIDDDEAVRESLAFLLRSADLEVSTYESATAFLAALPQVAPGCVITDVRMPGLSGTELLQKLKEMGVTMPVIVMTGHGDVPLAV